MNKRKSSYESIHKQQSLVTASNGILAAIQGYQTFLLWNLLSNTSQTIGSCSTVVLCLMSLIYFANAKFAKKKIEKLTQTLQEFDHWEQQLNQCNTDLSQAYYLLGLAKRESPREL